MSTELDVRVEFRETGRTGAASAVSEIIESQIVALRSEHPSWGPRKLHARLRMIEPETHWPAASTMGDILRRHGLVVPRRRRLAIPASTSPFADCECANDSWCVDYKGWFRTGDGRRCDPLTISDAYSRYLLRCQAVRRVNTQCARPLFEATFREYGLPRAIRSDMTRHGRMLQQTADLVFDEWLDGLHK